MTYRLKALAAAVMMTLAAPAFAQDTAEADSSVTIIDPITIDKEEDLRFGTVARPTTVDGTVAINATTGARSVTGGVSEVTDGTTPHGRAEFTVSGDGDRAFSAIVPATFDLISGATTLEVTLTSNVPATLTAGTATIGVGGSFAITTTTPTGLYEGVFEVEVSYN